ncbi:MAG: glycerol-3-phosphate 1-O-acyltransferase PlsY [Azovibrio sp.]|uniref:glycerol-3-phosphate 1-O-acyltransferase PlsY n=1 Tax=Azovibrio sp. TaxID=1872673 RepID=UPI003C791465
MSPALPSLFACLAAYLLGSVSFAVLGARLFKLADPRTYGSGNPGATNVLRSGNKKAALFTLLGDALKGTAAVLAARALALPEQTVGLVALAVFLGHLYPVFLKFKGGKGVATAAGVLLALMPWVGLATLATWLATAYLSRYSSLAAIVAALLAPAYAMLFAGAEDYTGVILVISLALLMKHRGNIQRLLAGQETKIGSKNQA